jgi:PAS domain S-box-containing protein
MPTPPRAAHASLRLIFWGAIVLFAAGALLLIAFFLTEHTARSPEARSSFVTNGSLAGGTKFHRVFILNSYNQGYRWSDDELRGIQEALDNAGLEVEPFVAFMDMKRIPASEAYFGRLKELLAKGYAATTFDAVVACDNDALYFLRRYRDELFPGLPLVFTGIDDFDTAMLDGRHDLTGVSENVDYAATLEVALKLRPRTRTVVVVTDSTTTGLAHLAALSKITPGFTSRLRFDCLSFSDFTLAGLAQRLGALPDDAVVLLLQHFRAKDGRTYPLEPSTAFLTARCAVPCFCITDTRVGMGALGGRVVSGYYMGRAAGVLVGQILEGRPVGSLPVVRQSPNKYLFDDRVLRRFKIDKSELPPGSLVINQPASIFVQFRREVITTGIVFMIIIACLIILCLEIVRRRHAEEAIAQEKERLDVTLASIGDGVITTDLAGRVTIMNKVAQELTGWSLAEAAGRPLGEVFTIINESSRKPCENPVDKVLASGQVIELANHTLLVSRDGGERIIADSGAPIRDRHGHVIGVVLVFRDMTEKQKLLETSQRTDKLQALGILAGGIAHDFNNLLSGIFGYIDLARDNCGEESGRLLDQAQHSLHRAKGLTQQLLTFARGGSPVRRPGLIGPLLTENTRFALSGANVACAFDIAADLWLVDFDENQIGQVIDNLVINALQAMAQGGIIRVSARNEVLGQANGAGLPPGRYVRLSFEDSGTGIPPDILTHIFDPFFTTKPKGNGLGLSTVHSIVQKHGGAITVDSVPGQGTTFHILLPASDSLVSEAPPPAPVAFRGSGRILVMEDQPSVAQVVTRMLQSMGFEVATVAEGGEALRRIEQAAAEGRPFRAVLMDLTIPGGMGGKEAIAALRRRDPAIVAIVLSGYSDDPIMADPVSFGFTDKIQKPFRRDELAQVLNRHLKSS